MTKPNQPNQPKNKFYVTTSIPYVNDRPHIGHLLEFVQADTLARYYRNIGEDTFLLTGTDEHGQKIFEAAAKLGEDTKEFAGKNSDEFRKLAQRIGMSNDYFVRTTDDRHKLAAQKLWQACEKDIYKGEYEGLYCVGCERYYTESEAEDEYCPIHKTKLSKLKMESYFFAQSKYKDKLLTLIGSGEFRILPDKRKNEMLTFIENLTDVSISRPKTQLEWGVEVPGDSEHVMYVWFDALSNYISAIGYADDSEMFKKFWPANVHVVGKDIARFHTILWPAMLMSAGLQVPRSVYVHPFINSGGQKMSKSLGNVIDPFEIIEKYGVDPVRYFLLRYIPSNNDGDFNNERFEEAYNADLANNLGNLVSRTAAMLLKYNSGQFDQVKVNTLIQLEDYISHCQFDKYLEEVFAHLDTLNGSIEENKPWELYKTDPNKTAEILNGIVNELLLVTNYLEPFLPETTSKIQQVFKDGKVDISAGILFPKFEEK